MSTSTQITRISDALHAMSVDLASRRDSEVQELSFVLPQYVTDHNDKQAYRDIDKQVNALARAYDRLISLLEKTSTQSRRIESSVDSFYGD